MTWIYTVSSFSVTLKNIPAPAMCKILHASFLVRKQERFFFFLVCGVLKWCFWKTNLHGFCSPKLFKPKFFCENESFLLRAEVYLLLVVMLWHDQCRLSSLYKLLLPSYLSYYLSFLPHFKGWWHKTSPDTSLEINQKLQSSQNNVGDKGQIISRICKWKFNSTPLRCSPFFAFH